MAMRLCEGLPVERFAINHLISADGNYELPLLTSFPFTIKVFSYAESAQAFPLNWHERLELFIPVEGRGSFRMGERTLTFSAGDILVVDVKSFHGIHEFAGANPKAIVVTFLPELICTLGSLACDSQYLIPFYFQDELVEPVLRRTDRLSSLAHAALRKLVACYFGAAGGPHVEAGCKAYLLEVLYTLSLHFGFSEQAQAVVREQRRMAERLRKIHSWLRDHYAEKISVADAAALCYMSESRFMKVFKKATGSTFVHYLTQLRLTEAVRLLRETHLSIAEIAARVGFNDQSYFDRKFKEHFHATPVASRRHAVQ
ncbi:MAG: helix-turn-helix transcriptional regulator [Bryobacteraceae bacterium]|nr:helix-turn-helix transcriptional regulator [Bryobacteraceae bacterium]